MATINYTNCPSCDSASISQAIVVKDYSVTGESFELWQCATCALRFTQHVPDTEAIGRYYQSENYISHSNTQRGLINRLYHAAREVTLSSKRKFIERLVPRGSLLDVGAGTGAFAARMKHGGWQVTAIEPDEGARKIAIESNGIELLPVDALYALPPQSFDVITLWHVLEHVHDLHRYLQHLRLLVKSSGRLLIAVPNYTSGDARHYREYWAAYDVPRHLYHFSPASMQRLLQIHELRITSMKVMWLDSFYISLLSEKYKTGKQHLLKGFWHGLLSDVRAVQSREMGSSIIYTVEK